MNKFSLCLDPLLKSILRIFMHKMHSTKNLRCLVRILEYLLLIFAKINGTHLQQFITRTILFPCLIFLFLSFIFLPSLFCFLLFLFLFMCSLFFLFFYFIFEKIFLFSHFVSKNQGALV